MLQVECLSKSYDQIQALKNVSFQVKAGSILGVLGPNGAGKTTLFKLILNLIQANEGSIWFNGTSIANYQDKIGFVAEERSLIPYLTMKEQIQFFCGLKGKTSRKHWYNSYVTWLKELDLLQYEHCKMNELSKGNQQKVQLMGALILNPDILILDEPFSGLDPINVSIFKHILVKLKQEYV